MVSRKYQGQNYKKNRKIHEAVSKNQVNYEEITTIKTVDIVITDSRGKRINSGVKITVGDIEINTFNSGAVIKNIPNEEIAITIEKEGYKTISADLILDAIRQGHIFTLEKEDSQEDSSVVSWPADSEDPDTPDTPDPTTKTFTFDILDENNSPMSGATITIGNETATTDAQGHASITVPIADNYSYSISKEGYDNSTGTLTNSDGNVATKLQPTENPSDEPSSLENDIEFTFRTEHDPHTPITNVEMTVNGVKKTADENGKIIFNIPENTFDCIIEAPGYQTISETGLSTINQETGSKALQMTFGFLPITETMIGFIANDFDTEDPLSGVTYTVNEVSKTSTSIAPVYFEVEGDSYTLKAEKEGYQTLEEEPSVYQPNSQTRYHSYGITLKKE